MFKIDWLKGRVLASIDGLNVVTSPFKPFTRPPSVLDITPLGQKDAHYWGEIKKRHLIGPNKEFLAYESPCTLGDMAIWQGCFAAAAAFRKDRQMLKRAFAGMRKLQYLGGNSRLARGAAINDRKDYQWDSNAKYYVEDNYTWIDNCSESSLIGHLFGLWSQIHLKTGHKEQAGVMLEDLAEQIVSDGMRLVDQDGTPARFGDLRPAWNTAPIRVAAGALLLLLSGRKAEFDEVCRDHIHTLTHLETHFMWRDPAYDDLLAYLCFTMFILHDYDGKRRARWKKALERLWDRTKEQGNSLYTYLYLLAMGPMVPSSHYLRLAQVTLAEFNTSAEAGPLTKGKPRENNTEPDGIKFQKWGWLSRPKRISPQPIPVWMHEPVDFYWQRSPYEISSRSEKEMCGLDYCLAHGIGKHGGVL